MISTPTWLSVAGPVTTAGSMPKRSRNSLTPPQAATGSLADSTTAVSAALDVGLPQDRFHAVGSQQPVAQLEHDDVGRAAAISLSMVRVSAGPHFAVVVTIPKSVKIIVRRAPESSNARMSRRRETPGRLEGIDRSARDGACAR